MATVVNSSLFVGVDLKCEYNNIEHHTIEISKTRLIVRRGQLFKMTLKLAENFNPQKYPLTFTARTGEHPNEDLGTMSVFGVPENVARSPSAKALWKVQREKTSQSKSQVNLAITPPADCPIGKYKLIIKYKEQERTEDLVVLFNAWCPADTVYMEKDSKKGEYVLNEAGVVYRGSINYMDGMDWDFGQFEEDLVDICMIMLDKSLNYRKDPATDVASRSDPVYLSRVLSAMINSEDDEGVLEGNWSGEYLDGFSPSHWSGSPAILRTWFKSDFKPVKYGQCWVFACTLCTVMRLLGIPSRVVTNFMSAHDCDGNLTIDRYFAPSGMEARPGTDSVWNFHVWIESWMKRPDLGKTGDYDGWQVVDATPQELSSGVFCCGPAPVKAIKQGLVSANYDTPFVFAEVNADCVDYLVFGEGEDSIMKMESDTRKVGQKISTKHTLNKKRRDITLHYKHAEGTILERVAFYVAITKERWRYEGEEDTDKEEATDGEEETEVIPESAMPAELPPLPEMTMRFEEVTEPIHGRDVSLKLVVKSNISVPRELSIIISAQAMLYNGRPVANIQNEMFNETLYPGKELSIPILVRYTVYGEFMVKADSMKVDALVSERGRPDHTYLAEDEVLLLKPKLSIIGIRGDVKVNQPTDVKVIFENPLDKTLKNCSMTFSGSGLLKEDYECKLPDLPKGTKVCVKITLKPYKTGNRHLLLDFDCSEFRDIKDIYDLSVI